MSELYTVLMGLLFLLLALGLFATGLFVVAILRAAWIEVFGRSS